MTKNKKIGVILNHISLRSDIRLFIEELSKQQEVVLFGSEEERKFLEHNGYEFRVAESSEHGFFWRVYNKFLQQLYFYFGNLPKTRKNYSDYVKRRLRKSKASIWQVRLSLFKLSLKLILPDLIDFDKYIKAKRSKAIEIGDVDQFISFTDVRFEHLVSQIIKVQKPLFTYIHSWDHIPKFHRFSKKHINYITWNQPIKEDLHTIHDIPSERITTLAASQFYFIWDYLKKSTEEPQKRDFEYIYFPCSFGYPKVAVQEVQLILRVADLLKKYKPKWKLMVRLYPMLDDWNIYKKLKEQENIVFDEYNRHGEVLLDKEQHLHKCEVISSSRAVFHAGTTIGLEASYFDIPVVYLNLKDLDYGVETENPNHIFRSWNQYHLQKYYLLDNEPGVVSTLEQLSFVLKQITQGKNDLMSYNNILKSYSNLLSIEEFTHQFLDILKSDHS